MAEKQQLSQAALEERLNAIVSDRFPDARDLIDAAYRLSRRAHEGQLRKHGEPYLVHPLRVALTLLEDFDVNDAELAAAALLHDVLEDAPDRISRREIESCCGARVLRTVEWLTSPSETEIPHKAERNRVKAEKVRQAPREVWLVKLADRTDNLHDACQLEGEASVAFSRRYHEETIQYYQPMAELLGDRRVLSVFQEAISTLRARFLDSSRHSDRITGPIVEVDVRRMYLPDKLDERYGPLLQTAVTQMEAVERGDLVNKSEGWQVGHYWLRNSTLAPEEYRASIDGTLRQVQEFCDRYFQSNLRFQNVLWIGIGGSALGPQMLYEVLRSPGGSPRMFFFDNTDPGGFQRTLHEIERQGGLHNTLVVVVSKSGGTKETRNGMVVAKAEFERRRLCFEEHAVAITRRGSKLDQLAATDDPQDPATCGRPWLARFEMWDWVGGRTSLFSAVGALPTGMLGGDMAALKAGAKEMDDATRDPNLATNPALLLATTWYHAVETRGLHNMVVLPYCDQLGLLGKYFQQLVMESLGKNGKGITVYGNKGATDQHSFIQQLREGRRDFFVNFIRVLKPACDWEVEPEVTAGDYLAAFLEGAAQALSDAARDSLHMTIERLDLTSLGALVALFERAVGFSAAMIGINAYDQPGVEAGKLAADAGLKLQQELTTILRSNPGVGFTVGELAVRTENQASAVFDILHRLTCAARFGLRQTSVGTTISDCRFAIGPR